MPDENTVLNICGGCVTIPVGGKRMREFKMKHVFVLLMVLAAVGFVGCILSPTEEVPQKPPSSNYKDLTNKEDIVTNLVQSYKDHNIDRYTELLHTEYLWYNQKADVAKGAPQFNTRDEDIAMTHNLFLAADHKSADPDKQVDRLDLSIQSDPTGDTWTHADTLNGSPCADCWQTTRDYYITVEMTGGTTTYIGNDLVTLYAVPVTKDGIKHYYLGRADDIPKSQ